MASLASPQDRGSLGFAAASVDVCAGLEEEVGKGEMTVDSGPLGECQSLLPYRAIPVWLGHTCKGVMPSSSVDFAVYFPLSNNFCTDLSSPSLASCIRSFSIGKGCLGGLNSRSLSST